MRSTMPGLTLPPNRDVMVSVNLISFVLRIIIYFAYPRICCAQHMRGLLPSCAGRRMAQQAAHLVEAGAPL